MKIGIVDADLIGRKKHRFPNLACEKISGYYKDRGENVILITEWDDCHGYDEVFVSKVFTDTPVPEWVKNGEHMHIGGTGFYFDQAPPLPDEIEHHTPDYHLYDDWIESLALSGVPKSQFKEYQNEAIGFLTRGCFRHCKFCVNQKYSHVFQHSPLSEFVTPETKRICMLDDNFFGYPHWKELLQELIDTGKPFKFKQGLDERLLTDEKCEMLFNSKYDGHFIFAFDNIEDYDIIQKKLQMIRRHTGKKSIKFYVLVGFKSTDATDIKDAFDRIELLGKYNCLPYVMKYRGKNSTPYEQSEYRGMYIQLANWCNQPQFFTTMTFREFCYGVQARKKTEGDCSAVKSMKYFERLHPEISEKYFDTHFWKEEHNARPL